MRNITLLVSGQRKTNTSGQVAIKSFKKKKKSFCSRNATCVIQLHHHKQASERENSALLTLKIYSIATYQSEERRRGTLTFQTLPRHQLQWFCFQLLYQQSRCTQTKQTYFCYPPWPSHELTFQPPNEKQHMEKPQHGKAVPQSKTDTQKKIRARFYIRLKMLLTCPHQSY